jgi:two-component system sensor histidine kinase EvgS
LRRLVFLVALLGSFTASSTAVSQEVALTTEERAWLDDNPDKLTLYYNTEFPPIEFASAEGSFEGLGADVIAMIEKRLGLTFRKLPSHDWNEHLAALESGECAIAPTIVSTPEREKYAYFTRPYATVPVVVITTRAVKGRVEMEDLVGLRVAVVSGFATENYLRGESQGRFEVVPKKNVPHALRDVSFGHADAFVENLAVAAYYIEQEGVPNLRVAGSTDYAFAWSIGVSRKYPLLFGAIEKSLDQVPPKELDQAKKKWISLEVPRGMDPDTVQLLKLVAGFTAALLVALAVITFVLKRRLKEKVARLKESESRFRQLFEMAAISLIHATGPGNVVAVNRRFEELFGYDLEDAPTLSRWWLLAFPEPWSEELEAWLRCVSRAGEDREIVPRECRIRCKDGTERRVLAEGRVFEDNLLLSFVDITELKRAQEERELLNLQLLQSQKMEAVGRLAGGVAHDFNNMLSVILGHAQLGRIRLKEDSPVHRDLSAIEDAARRSANLTRQLLGFARKQTVAPRVLDLNATVGGMLEMLRRVIGEQVELQWSPAKELWPVRIDPVQVDQILVNLCVNGRDAISGVGKITIATFNVDEDDGFVGLVVTDTGHGMGEETRAQIFEPFFSTKLTGQGVGLGLATVYGIVRQNGGFIDVRSRVGEGTTFEIRLPRSRAVVDAAVPRQEAPIRGNETLLIVEDEVEILEVIRRMLDEQGYRALVANSPEEALRLVQEHHGEIDLLLSDLVMPEMNGRDLAERLTGQFPQIKCLFMSGYGADVIPGGGILDEGVNFIQKPFSMGELTAKVKAVLSEVETKD